MLLLEGTDAERVDEIDEEEVKRDRREDAGEDVVDDDEGSMIIIVGTPGMAEMGGMLGIYTCHRLRQAPEVNVPLQSEFTNFFFSLLGRMFSYSGGGQPRIT